MSVIGSNILAGASGQGGGYNLTNSLRFRSSASAYLNRTFTTPTSSQKFTWSGWIKRGKLDSSGLQGIFAPYSSGTVYGYLAWYQDGIRIFDRLSGGTNYLLQTTAVYRDPSAWYHIVYAVDTTQATASNRVRLYVNGVEVTAFSSSTYPTQNNSTTTNSAIPHRIGYDESNTGYLDGYQTEVNFIDGQALTPSSFGETNAKTGVWQPKKYSGTYGTNGFYLPFTDNSALTTSSNVGLGKDFSGNGNYWTTNNISITSGSTYDSMMDVPTLTSATTANYCVLNPLSKGTNTSITNGNLSASYGSAAWTSAFGTLGVSTGKWYWEATLTSAGTDVGVGISTNPAGSANSYIGGDVNSWGYYANNGNKWNNGSSSSYGATYANGDVIGIALDLDAGTLTFYKNNTTQGTAFSSLASNTYFPALSVNNSSFAVNFGQRPFSYTPPTGFVALNTFNLPTPTIGATASTQANKYFDVDLWTGTGATQSITTDFPVDFAWIKSRSSANGHRLFDIVRGATKTLSSNSTDAEATESDSLTAFTSTGYTLGADTSGGGVNTSPRSYVGWAWKANGTGVTNTAGSITSTVSANTSAGFSVVTYTGNGSAGATVGHGLGVAPKMIIVKNRSSALDWRVYVEALGNGNALSLNTTAASGATANWNNTSPTSTVFSLGTASGVNGSGNSLVAYCFAEVAGYSKFGSYTGNGSTDGTFVYLGFRPRWVMIKAASGGTSSWCMYDTSRDTYNVMGQTLYANESSAESSIPPRIDFLSNGFKLRSSSEPNWSGYTIIYAAFAETPFNYANAR